jgi:ubiquinone/menaquinone biosynthesis C-methylase UbiE
MLLSRKRSINFDVPSLVAFYDEKTEEWRRIGAEDKARNIETLCGPESFATVLEVGCGTGAVLTALAKNWKSTQFTGIEIGTERSKSRCMSDGRISISGYDGKIIPFGDASFDLVYATHVLEHVVDERGFLGELRRVAKTFVYVEVPCELHVLASQDSLQQTLKIGHINSYTLESFVLTLETSGLHADRIKVFDPSYAVHGFHSSKPKAAMKMIIRRSLLGVSPWLATRLFTYHVGAVCSPSALLKL